MSSFRPAISVQVWTGVDSKAISTEGKSGRRKTDYCSDVCKEAFRAERQKRKRREKHGDRRCVICEKPIPLKVRGDAVTCSRYCSEQWTNQRRSEKLKADRLTRPPRPCANPDCDELIPPSASGNRKYHDEKCKHYVTTMRYRAKNPDYQQTYRYQMQPGDYDRMLAVQSGRCAICGTNESGGKDGRFHLDHHHSTDEVRGLLCHHCNIGIGMMRDDPDILAKAIDYLKDPPARKR